MRNQKLIVIAIILAAVTADCSRNKKPIATPQPTPTLPAVPDTPPPAPPQRVEDAPIAQPRLGEDDLADRSIDDLNRNSPLKPIFFLVDSADLDDSGRSIATANAEVLKKNPSWAVTIEGHCDERGTAEYNLALGERRASAVKAYLASLGVSSDRMKTVSYGKEFPFDMGHTEDAWSKNRRGHLVITAK
ncbi:MAG TPA: peptidoglycan-associated lipoprotein Pal [Vicinamibacterales bacterium]|jgi:peptidoglycan-associated lipoprotein|nr:peptidoglycan-associated lipoprotein Pal [Vicinamibacterales bacterium]